MPRRRRTLQQTVHGAQFGNDFPLLVPYGVSLWAPDVRGEIGQDDEAHDVLLTLIDLQNLAERLENMA
ncbi:hypothetical protein [Streptomyces olivochromogenes]|uniref:hypothetical protein n=1 Tax=Streptomyces olivochromogenes TaxID=1963 RepID=UPI001F2FAA60|nr:hypothetical protein [Streptomyces olivochromogenes]MCF3133687.1 hypothetical protein [Streptomyces olivochromogenes]